MNQNKSFEELSSCRCTTTSYGEIHTTKKYVLPTPPLWPIMQGDSLLGHWSFLGPGSETKWNATDTFKPGGEWDRVAEIVMNIFFASVDIPYFARQVPWNEEL